MDIEARLQNILENPKASTADFDSFYLDVVSALGDDTTQINEYIKRLKSICLERAIDHSKYKYREISPSLKKQDNQPKIEEDARAISSIDIQQIVLACREKAPFLSFSVFRLNMDDGDHRKPCKMRVIFSESLNEDWIHKTYHPDSATSFSDFHIKSLDPSHSWVILCLFHSSDRGTVNWIKNLLRENQELLILDLADYESGEREDHCWKKDRKKLFNGTVPDKPSLLIHGLLDAEQECLIKDFFGSNTGFLVCSDIKGGFSGARVILVAPNIGPGDPRKFVVKICEKSKSKLRREFEQFQNLVSQFWIEGQLFVAEFKESSHYEAIRYPFASADTMRSSISFTKKYKESDSVEVLQSIINNIFNHSLCRKWREQSRKRTSVISEAFSGIVNIADSAISLNYLISPDFSYKTDLDLEQLNKVLKSKATFLICPNHGDFHSDNIQVQAESNEVFLIDFGLTDQYPAGLDYAALEASIRFKLLDHSVDSKILLPLDSDPLSKFDNLIRPGEPFKSEIDKAQKLCSLIRERFLNDFAEKGSIKDLKFQYLCCLLGLCLRHIKYPNMNRRYILQVLAQIVPPLDI